MIHVDHVGFHGIKIYLQPLNLVQTARKKLRVSVILGKPVNHPFDGHASAAGNDARLAHSPADPLPRTVDAGNKLPSANETQTPPPTPASPTPTPTDTPPPASP